MNDRIRYPNLRAEVASALLCLRDLNQQVGGQARPPTFYDDLDLSIHILYDDLMVLPDPAASVSDVLYGNEIAALRAVDVFLGPMMRELGDQSDEVYVSDPRWGCLELAAGEAYDIMERNGLIPNEGVDEV